MTVTISARRSPRGPDLAPRAPRGSGLKARLLAKVEMHPSGCWRWQGGTDQKGYGNFLIAPRRSQRAHIAAYEAFVGPVPDGLQLDHLCHTRDKSCKLGKDCPHRRCVNPEHLEPVTPDENRRRGRGLYNLGARQVEKTHCPPGHPYDEANTYVRPNGARNCRDCKRERDAAYRRTRRERFVGSIMPVREGAEV